MNGFDYLSDARVQMYEKHKEDLHLLKKVYRKNLDREMYDRMFRSGEEGELLCVFQFYEIQWILWQERKSTEEI